MIKNIGFDLDGVILDNSYLKQNEFQKRGLYLERWQLNSNIIDDYITNKDLRRDIDTLSAQSLHRRLIGNPYATLAEIKKQGKKIYIMTARGKSSKGKKAALNDIQYLKFDKIFDEIHLLSTYDEKVNLMKSLNIDLYIDDRLDTLYDVCNAGIGTVLFDEFNLVMKRLIKTKLRTINILSEVIKYI